MFYRRKLYIVKSEFVEIFNEHFNNTNLPNQINHGSRLVGRWMRDNKDNTVEIFARWEYDSYEDYEKIEHNIRNDKVHIQRIKDWYESNGGSDHVLSNFILEAKNEALVSTIK